MASMDGTSLDQLSHTCWIRHCDQDTRNPVQGEVEGTIPPWLRGKLVRNGPGQQHVGDSQFRHAMDGFALIHSINIDEDKVTYMSRFLESDAYKLGHASNKMVMHEFATVSVPEPCRSMFHKLSAVSSVLHQQSEQQPHQPQLPANLRNTDNCNGSVLQVKDQLYALTETNFVRRLNPETLETDPQKFGYTHFASAHRATSHPHVDVDGTVYNLGTKLSGSSLHHAIVAYDNDHFENMKVVASIPYRWKRYPGYIHSFGMTQNYFIIPETPMVFDGLKLLVPKFFGGQTYAAEQLLTYLPNETTRFRIISRDTGKELATKYFSPGFFYFHIINSFESNGNIIMDISTLSPNAFKCMFKDNIKKTLDDSTKIVIENEMRRYIFPLDNIDSAKIGENLLSNTKEANYNDGNVSAFKQSKDSILTNSICFSKDIAELPRINYNYNTKPYMYMYAAHVSDIRKLVDFDGIIKINTTNGDKIVWEDKYYCCSEPVFVAAPNAVDEDDGVLLATLVDNRDKYKLELLVLDAKTVTEVARVKFTANGVVTPTIHGQFIHAHEHLHRY